MTEKSRTVEGDKLTITYDDGSVKVIDLPRAPQNIRVDKEHDEELVSGHVFKEEELQ